MHISKYYSCVHTPLILIDKLFCQFDVQKMWGGDGIKIHLGKNQTTKGTKMELGTEKYQGIAKISNMSTNWNGILIRVHRQSNSKEMYDKMKIHK